MGRRPYKRLSAKTLNEKVFAAVRAVFADAVNDDTDGNLVNRMLNISVSDTTTGTPTKLPYSDNEIAILFSSEVFRGKLARD